LKEEVRGQLLEKEIDVGQTPETFEANRVLEGYTPQMVRVLGSLLPSGDLLLRWLTDEHVMRTDTLPRLRLEGYQKTIYLDSETELPAKPDPVTQPGVLGLLLNANQDLTPGILQPVPGGSWNSLLRWLPGLGSPGAFVTGPGAAAPEEIEGAGADYPRMSSALGNETVLGQTLRTIRLITATCMQLSGALYGVQITDVSTRTLTNIDLRVHAQEVAEAMLLLRQTQARLEATARKFMQREEELVFQISEQETQAPSEITWQLTGNDMLALERASATCVHGLWMLVDNTAKKQTTGKSPRVEPRSTQAWTTGVLRTTSNKLVARHADVWQSGAVVSKARVAMTEEELAQTAVLSLVGRERVGQEERESRTGAILYEQATELASMRLRELQVRARVYKV
jgi:hypothetical protein